MNDRPTESGPEAEAPAADAARAFRKEHLKLELKGLRVADGLAMLQIIRRLVKSGAVEDYELTSLTLLRTKMIKGLYEATGVSYDDAQLQATKKRISNGKAE
jgi:hypothetical protein